MKHRPPLGPALWVWVSLCPAGGCLRSDPEHCRYDADVCGTSMVCDPCRTADHGCVASVEEAECRLSEALSGSDTTAGSDEASSGEAGGEPVCEAGEAFDPLCPDHAPICQQGACASCEAEPQLCPAGRGNCMSWGGCVECDVHAADACAPPATFCGQGYACGGCIEHCQCASGPECLTGDNLSVGSVVAEACSDPGSCRTCDFATGQCTAAPRTLWVTHSPSWCAGDEPMTGESDAPFCSLADAYAQMDDPGEAYVVVVREEGGEPFEERIYKGDGQADPWTVTLLGEDLPRIVPPASEDFRLVAGHLYLRGLEIAGGIGAGIRCEAEGSEGASLWVDDSLVHGNRVGIYAEGCDVTVRRTTIVDNEVHGIESYRGGTVTVESSIISRNAWDTDAQLGQLGIWVQGAPEAELRLSVRYSTLVANRTLIEGGINVGCGAFADVSVRNSVIFGLDKECRGAEVESSFTEVAPGSSYGEWFRGLFQASPDFHVSALDPHPLAELGRWQLGDPLFDVDGERLQSFPGAPSFVGADQPSPGAGGGG